MADLGIMNTNGLLTQSGREYVAFCQRMIEQTENPSIDNQEVLCVHGNIDDYPAGKDAFVRQVCIPAYRIAKEKNMRLEIQTEYDEI